MKKIILFLRFIVILFRNCNIQTQYFVAVILINLILFIYKKLLEKFKNTKIRYILK